MNVLKLTRETASKLFWLLTARLAFIYSVTAILITVVSYLASKDYDSLLYVHVPILPIFVTVLSIHIIRRQYQDMQKTYYFLGFSLMLPGIIASLLPWIGTETTIALAARYGGEVSKIVVENYVRFIVPEAHILGYLYILVGLFLVWYGHRCKHNLPKL